MNHLSSEQWEEQLTLYAAGALPVAEATAVEEQLRHSSAEGWQHWQSLQPVVDALLAAIPERMPSPGVKGKLLSQLPCSKPVEALIPSPLRSPAGILFQHERDAEFVPTPYPGITLRLLHVDQAQQKFSALLRLSPGAKYPSHHHDGVEECLVLEGTLWVGNTKMTVGDYQRAEADSDHVDQWSETGALLYINAPLSLMG